METSARARVAALPCCFPLAKKKKKTTSECIQSSLLLLSSFGSLLFPFPSPSLFFSSFSSHVFFASLLFLILFLVCGSASASLLFYLLRRVCFDGRRVEIARAARNRRRSIQTTATAGNSALSTNQLRNQAKKESKYTQKERETARKRALFLFVPPTD